MSHEKWGGAGGGLHCLIAGIFILLHPSETRVSQRLDGGLFWWGPVINHLETTQDTLATAMPCQTPTVSFGNTLWVLLWRIHQHSQAADIDSDLVQLVHEPWQTAVSLEELQRESASIPLFISLSTYIRKGVRVSHALHGGTEQSFLYPLGGRFC